MKTPSYSRKNTVVLNNWAQMNKGIQYARAREIVGFTRFGPNFETLNRFISQQEAEKSVHKTLYSQGFAIHRLTLSPVKIVQT